MLYYESIVSEERYAGKPHFDVTDHSSLARNFRSLVQSTEWRPQGTATDCSTFVGYCSAAGSDYRLRRRLGIGAVSVQTAVPTKLGAGAGDTATSSPNTTLGS
jgi:hypothetical protein